MPVKHLFVTLTVLLSLLLPNLSSAQQKQPKVVSIPDVNLAAAVRQEIGNSITTQTLLNLKRLEVPNRGIRDLTGLQYARNLERLDLGDEYIDGEGWSNNNTISDFTLIAGLSQLRLLDLSKTGISDVSPLAKLTKLTQLHLNSNNISDVSPLANLTQLTWLNLHNNTISDVSPLAKLTKLTDLFLSGNNISDVSPLAKLTKLTQLHLNYTNISDISGLAGLTQLTTLHLSGNNLSDISALSGLRQLTTLGLSNNSILDISALSGLTQLTFLDLQGNSISDISVLSELTQLTRLDFGNSGLFIGRNPLSYASINTHIPAMQAKGIEVKFDPRAPTTLVKISGTAQQGIANSELPLPFVVEVRDDRNLAFAGVPVKFAIVAGRGRLSNTTVTTDTTGRAETHLTLGRTAGTTAVRVTAREISQSVEFTAAAVLLSTPVAVPDVALHVEIALALGKPRNANFILSDMLKLTTLTADNANIRDLTGLQHASNLTTLSLNDNNLSDIAHLAELSKLTTLSLNNNSLSDAASLAALTQLKTLSLDNNHLSDVSALSGLTHLKTLSLENNNLSDVAPLAALTQLKTLSLDNNHLSDVSALSGLTHLKTLSLENNNLSDVTPLTSLTQLGTLQLRENPLSYPSLHTHIPAIQAAGARVAVDIRTPTTLVKVSGTQGIAGKPLPVIVEVRDEQGLGFSGVPVTFSVTAGGGRVSTSNVITDITGRARTTLTLGTTPGKNTVRAAAVEVRRPTLFTITGINTNFRVVIPDANLRAKIAQALSKPTGAQLTAGDMLTLEELKAPNANIQDLIGLEHAHNLEELSLGGDHIAGKGYVNSNTITDFSPLTGLTNLKVLDLSDFSFSDVSFLAKLTQLTSLDLFNNNVSDISPLANLTKLTWLDLWGNDISDVSPLAELTKLTRLGLSYNNISDISPLTNLTELTSLGLYRNSISDVSPLANLTELTSLGLSDTNISDVSPLANLTKLTSLFLSDTNISDVSPLANLTKLIWLFLSDTNISDVSPLANLTKLTDIRLDDSPLSYTSINTYIPAMQAKGIAVEFSPRTPTTLTKHLGDDQHDEPGKVLSIPLVVEIKDKKGVPFAGVPVKWTVTSGGGKIHPAEAISDTTGRAQAILTLGPNLVENTISVTAPKIQQPVIFTATAVSNPPPTFRKPVTFFIAENTTAVGTVQATDMDKQDTVTGYTISSSAGEDSSRFSITPSGVLRFKIPPDYERPTAVSQTNKYTVLVSATSGTGKRMQTGTQLFTITVTDVDEPPGTPTAPTITPTTPTSFGVTWVAPVNTGPPVTYQVRYREGNTGTFINADYNSVKTRFTLTGLRTGQRYQVQVRAKNDEGTSAWSPSGAGIPKVSPPIKFRDAALHVRIAEVLGKSKNAPITIADMLGLTELDARNANIRDLTGLEHARNLEELDLSSEYIDGKPVNSNKISDFTPIAGLTNLKTLFLDYCSLSDVSFLAKLTQLTLLVLRDNAISDIAPLAELTQLESLSLGDNNISDVSPLAELTQLESLYLGDNNISDISALAGLTELTSLYLGGNNISDVSPLANLTQLESLYLGDNNISDISALAGLTELTSLYLHHNTISDISSLVSSLVGLKQLESLHLGSNNFPDISALAKLTQLTQLGLRYNNISDISALAGLTELTSLDLGYNTISDISPLSGLTQLTRLELDINEISDVSPLVKLNLTGIQQTGTGLTLTGLTLWSNPLSYTSIYTHIPAMQAKGIEIDYDKRTPRGLAKTSGEAQQGIINTALSFPYVVEVRDGVIEWSGQGNRPFAEVPVTFTITTGDGRLSTKTTKTDVRGRASTHLTLGRTVGKTIVRVTAAQISQPVEFTATATRPSAPVTIPDANLRAKITETLGKPLGETVTIPDMLKLTTFTADNADILDLTGLQHAANLTTLSLMDNTLSDLAPLAGLTQLTTLDLRNNRILDMSPLVGLVQLKGSNDRHGLYLQGNPLSDTAVQTHIPLLQAAGVNVRFDRVLPQSRPMIVRIIYFIPRDRQPQPDIDVKLDRLIKEVQQFYADQMEAHGFGRKTFIFEADKHGNAVVYHVKGKFEDTYYHYESSIVSAEIGEQFNWSEDENIYLTVLDISRGIGVRGRQVSGTGGGSNSGGGADITASNLNSQFGTAAHELGHAFGLNHDFRDNFYIMSYGGSRDRISQCAAAWLDAHRAFNPGSQAASNEQATIKMLSPSLVSPPNTIRLRFEVTDPDGLHQAQLLTDAIEEDHGQTGIPKLVSCKSLNGKSSTVEFVTTLLTSKNEYLHLEVMDVNGYFTKYGERFLIDMTSLLPPPEIVSIPDPNLAAEIREVIGDSITTHTLLNLIYLYAPNRGITDLTGLEHAHNLKSLNINTNTIPDLTPIAGLTQLSGVLHAESIGISDISPLLKLTQLAEIELYDNPLNYTSIKTHIPAIEKKGIKVSYDNRTPTTLTKRLGDDQHDKPGKVLSIPLGVEVKDQKGVPFAGVPVTWTITSGSGKIHPAETVSDTTGRAQTTLTLGSKLGTNTVRVTAADIQQPVIFTATAVDNPPPTFRKPVTFFIAENTTAVGTVQATDMDKQDTVTGYTISSSAGEDSAKFSITPTGVLRFKTPPDYERPTAVSRTNEYTVLVSATSGTGKRMQTGTQLFTITVTDVDEPPDVPTAPTITPATAESVLVSWVAPTNTGPPVTYQVRYREGNTGTFINADYNSAKTTFTLTGLTTGKRYQVQVRAKNDEGTSAWSPSGAGVPQAEPAIEFRDANLHAKIAEALGKSKNAPITITDMSGLTGLYVRDVNIRDLTGLEHAHNLRILDIGHEYTDENRNTIRNRVLDVESIGVSDISPLLKLTQLIEIELYGNPLSYTSIKTHIPALQKKGVKVWFNNRTPTTLTKHLGDDQHGTTGKMLSSPLVVEVKDKKGVPFAGVPVTWTVTSGGGKIHPAEAISDTKGRAQAILTLGSTLGKNTVRVTAPKIKHPVIFTATATATAPEASQPVADVNGDGIVNIQDMVLVSSNFGKTGQNPGDVNGDGVVNISDLVLVAGAFGEGAAAAPTLHPSTLEGLTAAEVQDLLTQARHNAFTDPAYLRGIAVLEQLLARLLPKETALLANYPNPFNPETWIPYQLVKPAEVTLTIYTVNGHVVRTVVLGHQPAGIYHSKSRAAYWDGRNAQGERVASGLYFYTLTAGDFTATRKMLIRK